MDIKKHIVMSLSISILIFLYYESITYGIISFLIGVLVDLDHLFDYFKETGIKKQSHKFSIKHFFNFFYTRKFKKIYVLFHSYELIIILLVLEIYFKESIFIIILISWLQHLLFDQFTNYTKPFSYFFLYRLKVNFLPKKILNCYMDKSEISTTITKEIKLIC